MTHPEPFSYQYTSMDAQILAPKNMKYNFIYTIIVLQAMFLPFKPK